MVRFCVAKRQHLKVAAESQLLSGGLDTSLLARLRYFKGLIDSHRSFTAYLCVVCEVLPTATCVHKHMSD